MKLLYFNFIGDNLLHLNLVNNQSTWIKLDENSGKTVTRDKVGTFSKIQHTGIWVGRDYYTNAPIIMHNHYHYGSAYLSTMEDYSQNQNVYWKDEICANGWKTVLTIGLNHVIQGKTYRPLTYNCQTYTNTACHNSSHSEDVIKWIGRVLGGIAVVALLRTV